MLSKFNDNMKDNMKNLYKKFKYKKKKRFDDKIN